MRASNERAGSIHWERRNVGKKVAPILILLKQVLLNIRCIKNGYRGVVDFQIIGNGAERFCSCEVAHDRNDDVLSLHFPDELEILLRGQVASRLSLFVCRGHKIGVPGTAESEPKPAARIINTRT